MKIKPVLSEKSVDLIKNGRYTFYVSSDTTKGALASELKRLYGVAVKSVNIVNLPAKVVNFRRHEGVRARRHKAYVWITGTKKIPGFEEFIPEEKKEQKLTKVKKEDAKTS